MIDPQHIVKGLDPDEWLMFMAWAASLKSKDPSTKVGCVIVDDARKPISWGYNGFPRGIKDTFERLHTRDLKYPLTVHAEMNACYTCTQTRQQSKTLYATHRPCIRCAMAIIQIGVVRVVWDQLVAGWEEDGTILLREAGVVVEQKNCKMWARVSELLT